MKKRNWYFTILWATVMVLSIVIPGIITDTCHAAYEAKDRKKIHILYIGFITLLITADKESECYFPPLTT